MQQHLQELGLSNALVQLNWLGRPPANCFTRALLTPTYHSPRILLMRRYTVFHRVASHSISLTNSLLNASPPVVCWGGVEEWAHTLLDEWCRGGAPLVWVSVLACCVTSHPNPYPPTTTTTLPPPPPPPPPPPYCHPAPTSITPTCTSCPNITHSLIRPHHAGLP